MQNEALALKVAEYEAEIERLKNLLVDQKDLTHKKEMESLVLEQKLRDRDSDCRARDSLIDEKKKVQDGLQNQLLQAQSQERLQLMPWAVHRPVVETCWASEIVHGSWALNLPPNTEVELPAKLAYSGYPVDVPGGSEAILPEGKELRVAFPPYSVLTFAKDVFFEEITVPSGTTIITDAKAAGPLHMTVPPGTRIIPPGNDLDHKLRLLEPSSEPDSAEASAASADDEIYFAPAGVPSAITAPAGSMLEMPMGVRSQLRVPSGCQYIFQMGQKRHLTVPGQSHIRLRDGGDGVLLLPPETCIRLPPADADHRSWNVFLPSDSIATVPKTPATSASLVNITVPNRTRIDGPEEGLGSASVPMGSKDFKNTSGIPLTTEVGPGSVIRLPEPPSSLPQDVAARMHVLGHECVGVALSAMEPSAAASALSDDGLDAEFVAACLTQARPDAINTIIRRVQIEKLRSIFLCLTPSEAGVLLAGYPSNQLRKVLDDLQLGRSMMPEVFEAVVEATTQFHNATMLMNGHVWQVQEATKAVMQLEPRASARLLAGTSAFKAASVLVNSSGHGFRKSAEWAEEIASHATLMHSLGVPYKHLNIKRAGLLQDLADAKNDLDLHKRASALMDHFLDGYGVACTLTRVDESTLLGLEAGMKEICEIPVTPRQGNTRGSSPSPSRSQIRVKSRRTVLASTDVSDMKMSKEDHLEVVASTEDVSWGSAHTVDPRLGMSVQMDSCMLIEYQEEALQKNSVVYRGSLMLVPVVLPDGTKWGAISHIMPSVASQHLLNGSLRRPSVNSQPKALECLLLMAMALRKCVCAILTATRKSVAWHQANNDAIAKELATAKNLAEVEKRDALVKMLTGLNEMKRQLSKEINGPAVLQMLQEIKGYSNPPYSVAKTLTALMVILNFHGFEQYLGETLCAFPAEDELGPLWAFTRNNIQLSTRHPDNIIRILTHESKENGEPHADDDAAASMRLQAAQKMVETVDKAILTKASKAAVVLYDWIQTAIKHHAVEKELLQLEPEITEEEEEEIKVEGIDKEAKAIMNIGRRAH
eukprot:gene5114-6221_t